MNKKKRKFNDQTKILLALTVVVTFVGITFGRFLDDMLLPASGAEAKGNENTPTVVVDSFESSDEQTTSVNEENTIYLMQLGVFKTYDNLLALVGEIQKLGYQFGVVKSDGNYVVFSHVSGNKEVLADIEAQLQVQDIPYFIKDQVVPTDDLRWNYYLQAVKQKPFEMDSEFIQSFTNDDLHIFGYYTTLSSAAFEPLANERQKMLLEIYQWLTE